MAEGSKDALLELYQLELAYLRESGALLARDHPALARRLALSGHESPDPHVERLLEGFAFLAARIHQRLDDDYSQLTNDLLEQLYPYAIRPIPSVAVLRFEPKDRKAITESGESIARGTLLSARAEDGTSVMFTTGAAVSMWPLEVRQVKLLGSDELLRENLGRYAAAIDITLARTPGTQAPLAALPLRSLRFHLGGSPLTAGPLFDALVADAAVVQVRAHGSSSPRFLDVAGLPQACGFTDDEALYPPECGVHPALRLMAEYCACPQKFAFVDIPLTLPADAMGSVDVRVLLDRMPRGLASLSPQDLQLGCTPAINLFTRTAEPLRVDGTRREYRVEPDAFRSHAVEAYAVQHVHAMEGLSSRRLNAYQQGQASDRPTPLWHTRRVEAAGDLPGSELLLTLVDPDFQITAHPSCSLNLTLWCTNRQLATSLSPSAPLTFEVPGPALVASFARTPTASKPAALAGSSRWRLVAQLAANHLPLAQGDSPLARQTLQTLLKVHDLGADPTLARHIAGIVEFSSRRIVGQVGRDAWRGWRNGLELRLVLDPSHFSGHSAVMFAGMVAHFLALYAAPNCFIRTVLLYSGSGPDQEPVKTWTSIQGSGLVL